MSFGFDFNGEPEVLLGGGALFLVFLLFSHWYHPLHKNNPRAAQNVHAAYCAKQTLTIARQTTNPASQDPGWPGKFRYWHPL